MNQFDDLFATEGWIVTKCLNGKTKVSVRSCDETTLNDISATHENWISLEEGSKLAECEDNKISEERQVKTPYKEVSGEKPLTGFLFIRDLLNLKKPNSLSSAFLSNGLLVRGVAICARITSVELKNDYFRLIVDDGTSAILCMVKKIGTADNLYDKENSNRTSSQFVDNRNTLRLLKDLELHSQKLEQQMATDFDETFLGAPLMIMGILREFHGKNYIFAQRVRLVTEEYFVHFMNYLVESYEYKVNFMFE